MLKKRVVMEPRNLALNFRSEKQANVILVERKFSYKTREARFHKALRCKDLKGRFGSGVDEREASNYSIIKKKQNDRTNSVQIQENGRSICNRFFF